MSKRTIAFEIDDNLTADQTLAAFAEAMKQADAPSAEILAPVLSDLSLDVAIASASGLRRSDGKRSSLGHSADSG